MGNIFMADITNIVHNIDARNILSVLPKEAMIQTTITSPPYYDMKDYGVNNQIGFGQSYEAYLDDLQSIFEKVLHRTTDDGTLWIIIDTFKRNGSIVPLPFDLANRLRTVGWCFQDIIVWKKDKTVPWSSNGFTQKKIEYILFFSKNKRYKYNKDIINYEDALIFAYIKGKLEGFLYESSIKQVIIDEAQDYNKLQYLILKKIFILFLVKKVQVFQKKYYKMI